jgi:hypothetical protein
MILNYATRCHMHEIKNLFYLGFLLVLQIFKIQSSHVNSKSSLNDFIISISLIHFYNVLKRIHFYF